MSGGFLFLSAKCNFCKDLKKVMGDQDLLQFFTEKYIDNLPPAQLLSLNIKFVPTLIVFNKDPKTGKVMNKNIYEEKKAFEWVENIWRNRRDNMIKTTETSRKLIQIENKQVRNNDGIMEHNPQESQGRSDAYAYWSNDLKNDKNIPQPKNYLEYGKDDMNKIITLIDNTQSKINKSDTNKLVKDIENSRKTQDLNIDAFNQEQHLNVAIKTRIAEI